MLQNDVYIFNYYVTKIQLDTRITYTLRLDNSNAINDL